MSDDLNLSEGDIVTVYFGGATDTGVGEATLRVDSVGETVVGTNVREYTYHRGKLYRAILQDGEQWRIDADTIHAVHFHGTVDTAKVVSV